MSWKQFENHSVNNIRQYRVFRIYKAFFKPSLMNNLLLIKLCTQPRLSWWWQITVVESKLHYLYTLQWLNSRNYEYRVIYILSLSFTTAFVHLEAIYLSPCWWWKVKVVINKKLYNCCESVVYVWKSPLLPPPSPNQDVLSSVSGPLTVSSKGRKKGNLLENLYWLV